MVRRKRKHSDFTAEIEAHIKIEADRLRRQGLSEEEALAAARREFGNIAAAEERFYESRRWLFWDHLVQDLRLAARLLAKTPGWTAVAALTVALGIGATAAIFSTVNAVLLRPLPFPQPQQLYGVIETTKFGETTLAPDYFTMRENLRRASTQSIAEMAAYDTDGTGVNWAGADHRAPHVRPVALRSSQRCKCSHFTAGRSFRRRPAGREHVVMLSYRLWQNKFGGDPAIVGRTDSSGPRASAGDRHHAPLARFSQGFGTVAAARSQRGRTAPAPNHAWRQKSWRAPIPRSLPPKSAQK